MSNRTTTPPNAQSVLTAVGYIENDIVLAPGYLQGLGESSDGSQGSIPTPPPVFPDWIYLDVPAGGATGPLTIPAGYGFIENVNDTAAITGPLTITSIPYFFYQGDSGGQTFEAGPNDFGGVEQAIAMNGYGNLVTTPLQTGGLYVIATGLADAGAVNPTFAAAPTPGSGPQGNTVAANGGNASICAGLGNNSIYLGSGSDSVASVGTDTIIGGSGVGAISATGNDSVLQGSGNLAFYNGAGASFISGDSFVGNVGALSVLGGSGSVTVMGGNGAGLFAGGTGGNNVLAAGNGAATLFGGGSGDILAANGAGGASDVLVAGAGNETLFGANSGSSYLFAGSGQDVLVANNGNTFIEAGTGGGDFFLGSGQDTVGFSSGVGGTDAVIGFNPSADLINLSGYASGTASQVLATETVSGGNSLLHLPDGTNVLLVGVTTLSATNFY